MATLPPCLSFRVCSAAASDSPCFLKETEGLYMLDSFGLAVGEGSDICERSQCKRRAEAVSCKGNRF